jgi:glucosamine--fructose-6-phosphate aminotransferase (isomerizing)
MSFMLAEIREQPGAIRRFLDREAENVGRLAAACRERKIRQLFIAARGTSDHAAVYAKYLVEIVTGLPVCLAAPSVFSLYGARLRLDDALILGISQSGAAADTRTILEVNREAGRLTACITNHPDSPMARAAEHVLNCNVGEERSLPATKTYTASLAAVAALVAEYAAEAELAAGLQGVPEWIEAVLQEEEQVADRVERYRYMESCVVLGRGYHQCTALETALKLTETSYLRANAYSAADFLHGPVAAVDEGLPCFVYAPAGRTCAMMADVIRQLRARRAELLVVSDREELLEQAQTPFRLPPVPEPLSPLVAIVLGQLFAYHLARVKGRDPDRPRGLKKVTVTA